MEDDKIEIDDRYTPRLANPIVDTEIRLVSDLSKSRDASKQVNKQTNKQTNKQVIKPVQ